MAGVAVSAFLGAGTSSLMLFFPDRLHGVLVFMVGGLGGISWPSWGQTAAEKPPSFIAWAAYVNRMQARCSGRALLYAA